MNVIRFGPEDCMVRALASVDFCLRRNDPSQVDLTYDGVNLRVNAAPMCTHGLATSSLGSPAQDVDTYDFPGRSGELVEIVLDRDGVGGSTGRAASLRVLDQAGGTGTLAERTGELPIMLQVTLPGRVSIQVAGDRSSGAFRGHYTLEVTPVDGDIGQRSLLLRPRRDVEE